jgi:hypothetical protein
VWWREMAKEIENLCENISNEEEILLMKMAKIIFNLVMSISVENIQ